MKLVYSSSSLDKKATEKGEHKKDINQDTSIEDLVMQIDLLSERVKQLEVNHAWSERILS